MAAKPQKRIQKIFLFGHYQELANYVFVTVTVAVVNSLNNECTEQMQYTLSRTLDVSL